MSTNLVLAAGACVAAWAMLRLLGNERERARPEADAASPAPASPAAPAKA